MNLDHIHADTADIILSFASTARPIIRTAYDTDSCIASTRIAVNVFHEFGLRAKPMVARMKVCNRAMAHCIEQGLITDADSLERCSEQYGAHALGIGFSNEPMPPGYWAGHLVAVVERSVLVDASADQASRSVQSIVLPGVVAETITRRFEAGLEPLVLRHRDGGVVQYHPSPRERSYRGALDWRESSISRFIVKEIVTAMTRSLCEAKAA
jgi:hypothetical protein